MTIAAGMKDIVQDIVSSREVRVAEVKGLKKEANEMLGSFEASHKKMSAQLRQDLAQDKAKMRGEVKAMRSGLAQGAAARESEVHVMLNDFRNSHQQMGAQQRKELAQHKAEVRAEVKTMRSGLAQGVAARESEVHVMLNDFQGSRQQMGAQQRKELAQHKAEVGAEVKTMRSGLAQGVAARKSEVKGMLNDFQGSRQQMSAQQKKLLADYDRGIKSEVAGMRQETIADLREARTAWQALASNGQAKGGGAEILPKWEAPPHNVEAELLAAVIEHPKGITLTEVADNLGIAPIVLGRASKSLLDKKLIRKKHKLYVPASAK
jgi:hypothetical protein